MDYVCGQAFNLVAVTETWFKPNNDSIRAQLSLWLSVLKPRKGYRDVGTALSYKDSMKIISSSCGQLESFEYSEWIVSPSGTIPLSHRDSTMSEVYYKVHITRVLHTTRISNIDSEMFVDRKIREMVDFELGKEIKKDVFRHVTSVTTCLLFLSTSLLFFYLCHPYYT